MEVVTARRAPPSWTEFHQTFTICTMEGGGPVPWRLGSQRFTRSIGTGMLVGPGELHVDRPTSGEADYRVLRFAPQLVDVRSAALGQSSTTLKVAEAEVRGRAANDLFLSLHRTVDEGHDEAAIHQLIDACLTEVVRHCVPASSQQAERAPFLRAREYILQHLGERITLDALAAAAGMRKWGLVTLFRRHVGVPPLRYALHIRVARARTLLSIGRPPCEVAAEAGFFDQSHLHRSFRRTYGVAPGEYQRSVLSR